MIKVPHTLEQLDELASAFYTTITSNFNLSNSIENRASDKADPFFDLLRQDLDKYLETIITGRPAELESLINEFAPSIETSKNNYIHSNVGITKKKANAWFKNCVLNHFNYDTDHLSFTKLNNGKLAYDHARVLGMNTCPYCNVQFTLTMQKGKKKTRPQFDHFFDKGSHPYLALSFYNLIPSCSVCNSSLKGSSKFLYSTHLHPFMESMNNLFVFKTKVDSVDFLVSNEEFKLKLIKVENADENDTIRANRNINDFALIDRYQFHVDYAGEIIKKAYIYDDSSIKELLNEYRKPNGESLFASEAEIIELLLGNYIHEDKLHKRILSKLTKDIAEEFGLKF